MAGLALGAEEVLDVLGVVASNPLNNLDYAAGAASTFIGPEVGAAAWTGGLTYAVLKDSPLFAPNGTNQNTQMNTGDFVTPNSKKETDMIGKMTSKRQKLARSKNIARSINFTDAQIASGVHRSINVVPPLSGVFREFGATENSSVSNMSSAMQVGNDGEVPVAKVPRLIAKIHPDVFNIRLPFYKSYTIQNGWVEKVNLQPLGIIRLNSIYDIFKNSHLGRDYPVNPFLEFSTAAITATTANDPVTASTTVSTAPRQDDDIGPVGRNVWQGHFKYYRVLRSDVKLTFINANCSRTGSNGTLSNNPGASVNPTHNMYAIGYELVDEDGKLCENLTGFMTAKGVVRDILTSATGGERIQFNAVPESFFTCSKPAIGVMQYTYKPENWNQHVEQKGQETRWTAIGANPTLDHLLAIRAFHMDSVAQSFNTYNGIEIIVQIEYEVQFRECLDAFIKEGYQSPSADT